MKIKVYNLENKEVGDVELSDDVFGVEVKQHLLWEVTNAQRAGRRAGTQATKERSAVAGTNKKLFRQKGTGRARAGNARTCVRTGGGHAFGKKNRDYSYRLPRKAVRSATKMALLSKFQDGQAVVLGDWKVDAPKTKEVASALKSLGVDGSVLIATDDLDQNLYRSARNISDVQVLPASDLNAYALLRHRNFVVTVSAMDRLLGRDQSA